MDPGISLDGTKLNSLCGESEADYRKDKKKKKKKRCKTGTGGPQIYATPAVSVVLTAFLCYSIVEAKP